MMSTAYPLSMSATAAALRTARPLGSTNDDSHITRDDDAGIEGSNGDMSTHRSVRLRTTYALLASYGKLSVPALLQHLDSSFTHHLLPIELGMPRRDLDTFLAHVNFAIGMFSGFAMLPLNVLEDPVREVVIAHCHVVRHIRKEFIGGNGLEWRSECMLTLTFSEDETKVVSIEEFVDSAKAIQLKNLLVAARNKRSLGEA